MTYTKLSHSIRRILSEMRVLTFIKAHSALAAMIGDTVSLKHKGRTIGFDGFWSSSLTESLSRGMPDTEYLDFSHVHFVTDKPLIYDADTGGLPERFAQQVPEIHRHGVSSTIIEDKTGAKCNSLFGAEVAQQQDNPQAFAENVSLGKEAQRGKDFMIIARIDSLILGKGGKGSDLPGRRCRRDHDPSQGARSDYG